MGENRNRPAASYETVIGLETHIALKTETKAFWLLRGDLRRGAEHALLPCLSRHAGGAARAQ